MHVTWHGFHTVKVQFGDTIIVFNPHSTLRGKGSVVALTDPTNQAVSHVSGVQGDPLILSTPGEYSFHGSSCRALGWRNGSGMEQSIHVWNIEGMTVLYLGSLNRPLEDEELQELEKTPVDVLLVPVGGGDALTSEQAVKTVTTIEPRVVIPINYARSGKDGKLEPVNAFAKELGASASEALSKATLRKNKLPVEETEVMIISG